MIKERVVKIGARRSVEEVDEGVCVQLREKHHWELENLTLTTQPLKTLKFFTLAVIQYIKKTAIYLLAKGGWVMLFSVAVGTLGIVLMTLGCLHEKVFVFSQ
ncbi:Vacuole membrane protein KMS1 [Glycine soja]|uniref:Vacuole membrane protein KMS1 n=1 Tax=Glycine soja TaxID=3848 RepID=A0A445HVJ7_GLYSO|nr:Vacuole membrane protein KMS1 [Glycine soja]